MSSSRGQQQQASTCRCRRCTLSHLLGGVVGPAEDGPCTNPSQNNALSMADELSGLLPALASQSSAQDAVMAVPIRVRMAIVRTSSYSAAPPKGGFPSYEDTPLERKLETYYPPVTAYGGNSAAEATVAELTEYIVEELFVGNKEGHFWERDREVFVKMLLGDEWEGTLPNVIFRYTAGKMNGQRSGGKLTNGGKKALRATWVVHFSLSEKCEGDFVDVSSTANAYKTLRGIQSQVPKGKKADLLLKAHVLCSEEGKDAPPKRKRKGLTEKGSKDDDGGTPKRKKVVTADAKVPVSITKYPNGIPPALSEAWENQKMAESSPKRKKKADAMEVERPSAAAAKPSAKKTATSAKVDSKDDDSATESSEDEVEGDKAFDFAALGKKKVDDELESPSSSSSSSEEDESQESDAEDRDAMQLERGVDKPNTSDRKAINVKEAAKKASAKAAAMNEANENGSTAAAGNKKAKIDEEAESSSSESSSSEEDESDESDTEGGGINTDTNQQKKAPVSKRSNSVAGSKAKARVAVGKKKATIDEKSESSSASSSSDEGGSDSDEEESAEKESGKEKGASSKVLSVVSSDAGDDGKDESIPEEKAEQDAEADSSSGSSSDSSSSSEESDDDGEDDDKGKKTTTAWVRKGVGAPVQQTMEKSKGVTFKLDAAGKATPYDLATTDSDPNFTQESAIVPTILFDKEGDSYVATQQKAQKKRSKGDVPVDESDDDSASSSSSGSSSSDSEESDDGEGGLQTTTKPKHSAANSGRDDSEGESSGDDEEGANGKPAQDTDANNDAQLSSSGSGSSSDSSSDSDSDSSSSSEEAEEEKKVTKKKETTPSSSALPVVRSSRGRRRTPLVSMSKKIVINPSNGKSKARTFAR